MSELSPEPPRAGAQPVATDPRGIRVRVTSERQAHIRDRRTGQMTEGEMAAVASVIEQPDFIEVDDRDTETNLYYRRLEQAGAEP